MTPEAQQAAQVLAYSSRLNEVSADWRLLAGLGTGLVALRLTVLRPSPVRPSPADRGGSASGTTAGRTQGGGESAADAVLRALWARGRRALAGPHLALRSVSLLHGPSGEGKSRWLSEVVYALVRGVDVFGWKTTQTAVVWVTEEPLAVWKDKGAVILREDELVWRRWKRWARVLFPRWFAPTVWVVSLPDIGYEASLPAFRELWRGRIYSLAKRTGARLVIGDTVFALCPQAVADNTTAKVFMGEVRWLAAKTGAAIELVHHDNDAGKPLGAKMLKGDADFTHHVTRLPRAREDDRRRRVEFGKRYEPVAPDPLVYEMDEDGRLQEVDARPSPGVRPPSSQEGEDALLPRPLPVRQLPEPGRDDPCKAIYAWVRGQAREAWPRAVLYKAVAANPEMPARAHGPVYAHLKHLVDDGWLCAGDDGALRVAHPAQKEATP
jgi:hypothetical protein